MGSKQKVENLYNLSNRSINYIKENPGCQEYHYVDYERSIDGAKMAVRIFLIAVVIALLSCIIFSKHFFVGFPSLLVFSAIFILEWMQLKKIESAYSSEIIGCYNKFYEMIKGKPFLPSRDKDIEDFFVWLHGAERHFEERLLSEEIYMQIGFAYGTSMGGEYNETDDNGNFIRTVRYFHAPHRHSSILYPSSNHSLKELALVYQVFKIHDNVN